MFDAIVIGGGFKGMMTAYGLAKQNKKVVIIEQSNELGGFMEPISWQGHKIDRGPQFLDGITPEQKEILDDIMQDGAPLAELDFSYATYWNGITTSNFAIPDYRHLPTQEKASLLYEALSDKEQNQDASNLAALYTEGEQTTFKYVNQWCKKFLNTEAKDLSPLNKGLVTFFGRKLLFDNEHSLYLKQSSILDNVLAAEKVTINHNTFNLYPKNKTLGYFKEQFIHALSKLKVNTSLNSTVKKVEKELGNFCVKVEQNGKELSFTTSDIYFSGTIESTESILFNKEEIKSFIKPVSQVFYLMELSAPTNAPFYTMNYSEDLISRVTYFLNYAQTHDAKAPIICVEVPTETNSDIWNDPDSYVNKVKCELKEMGFEGIKDYKAVKINSTYRALLDGYETKLSDLLDNIEAVYGSNIHILTPHILTRAAMMHELHERGILDY